jgi:hypothetical protein
VRHSAVGGIRVRGEISGRSSQLVFDTTPLPAWRKEATRCRIRQSEPGVLLAQGDPDGGIELLGSR